MLLLLLLLLVACKAAAARAAAAAAAAAVAATAAAAAAAAAVVMMMTHKLALNRISYTLVQCVKPGDPSLNKYVGECERVYTSAIDELRQRPGPLPKFTPLKIDHSKHEDFAEVLLTSTMRSVAGAVPLASKVFDAAHASGMAVIAKA